MNFSTCLINSIKHEHSCKILYVCFILELSRFAIGGVHIAPSKAVEELKALKEVFVDVQQRLRVNDVMMMGDLNADCGYVPQYRWAEIALKSDPSCHWLIGDEVDTTVSNTHCAYDRYVLSIADNLRSQDDCNFLKYNIKAIIWAFANTHGI